MSRSIAQKRCLLRIRILSEPIQIVLRILFKPGQLFSKADDYQELNYEDLEGVAGGVAVYGAINLIEEDSEGPKAPNTYGMIVD